MGINCRRCKFIIVILLLIPSLLFAQKESDEYAIYSKYLKYFQSQRGTGVSFVVTESGAYGKKIEWLDIGGMVNDFRSGLQENKNTSIFFRCEWFRDSLKNDTS